MNIFKNGFCCSILSASMLLLLPVTVSAWSYNAYSGHTGYGHTGYGHHGHGVITGFKFPGYGYGHRGHHAYYGARPIIGVNVLALKHAQDNYHAGVSVQPKYSEDDPEGWKLLARGRYDQALKVFASQAQAWPDKGTPKAGYALARALGGNLTDGTWAMRRAFRIDPDALHYVDVDRKLRPKLKRLLREYRYGSNDADQAFMTGAIAYLLHDYRAAKKSAGHAIEYGDESQSVTNLLELASR